MNNSKNIKEISEKIEVEKELLKTMPKNNAKNIERYNQKVEELLNDYKNKANKIHKILENRYDEQVNIQENSEIQELDNKLQEIEKVLFLLNEKTTSYEKMDLDRMIYKIRKYYKENLDAVNEQISLILDKFSKVGISLGLSDFDYSIYVKQYMEVFLEEYEKGALSSEKLKNTFEEIYWKCPDIIIHIELNVRNLYLKNQQQIDKFFARKKDELLSTWEKTPDEILEIYMKILANRQDKISNNKKIILDDFLRGKLNTKNFEYKKVLADLDKILPKEIVQNLPENQQEIRKNIFKFLNSLYEYKNYEEFKFIIDDIKTYYNQKEQYKNIYDETKKQIESKEKELKKLNKKNETGGFFGKKNTTSGLTSDQNTLISEIKDLYRKLDLDKFYNKIYSTLTDNSTIFETLSLASSYYEYLTSCIIKNDKTITQKEIDEKINKLNDFLSQPYNNIINNMTILQEKDIGTIIKDRYKLLNFNVEKEDLQIENIDSLITILETIEKSFDIKNAGLEIENIEELVELKKLLKK